MRAPKCRLCGKSHYGGCDPVEMFAAKKAVLRGVMGKTKLRSPTGRSKAGMPEFGVTTDVAPAVGTADRPDQDILEPVPSGGAPGPGGDAVPSGGAPAVGAVDNRQIQGQTLVGAPLDGATTIVAAPSGGVATPLPEGATDTTEGQPDGVVSSDGLASSGAILTQAERNARWRARDRERYNAYMRAYRRKKADGV